MLTWLTRTRTGIVPMLLSTRMKFLIALVALSCAAGARADIIDFTIMNAKYDVMCDGGGACIEEINGSFNGNSVTQALYDSSLRLTGTLTAYLAGFGTPPCL